MIMRPLLLIAALLASSASASAQSRDALHTPVLRANVSVSGDIVRIGDLIDNAGSMADIAVYRAPDPGTTGTLPVAQVLASLRAHQVIGIETRDIRDVTVTRQARALERAQIETQIAQALEKRNGLGEAANLGITFDRDPGTTMLDAKSIGALIATNARYEPRTARFDVTFEIAGDGIAPARLRFTGTAVETVETAVLNRPLDRNDLVKASDVTLERKPKAEAGGDLASRDQVIGMQARRQLRAGQPLRTADLARPDLVQRDQSVMLIYEAAGMYLTIRGKALENGTEGDAVTVLNLQSKRTVSGTVIGRGQVAIVAVPQRTPTTSVSAAEPAAPVALAANARGALSRQAE